MCGGENERQDIGALARSQQCEPSVRRYHLAAQAAHGNVRGVQPLRRGAVRSPVVPYYYV